MGRRSFSKEERKAVFDKCGGHCAYCGCQITMKQMQVDHKIPLKNWWGANRESDANGMDNLLPACASCNHYKSTYDLETFRRMLEKQPRILERDRPTYRMAVRYGLVTPTPHPVKFYFETQEVE